MAEGMIGEVRVFAGNFAPRSWALCEGQLLSIAQNSALFSILGTTYGGDGRTTFQLPDLRGRAVVGPGTGPGLSSYTLGQRGGVQSNTLTINQLPSHTHTANARNGDGNTNVAQGNFWSKDLGTQSGTYHSGPANGSMNPAAISSVGNGQSVENRQPYLAMYWIICVQGIYPSRN
jgi:microcystin-dependent protein